MASTQSLHALCTRITPFHHLGITCQPFPWKKSWPLYRLLQLIVVAPPPPPTIFFSSSPSTPHTLTTFLFPWGLAPPTSPSPSRLPRTVNSAEMHPYANYYKKTVDGQSKWTTTTTRRVVFSLPNTLCCCAWYCPNSTYIYIWHADTHTRTHTQVAE